MVACPGMRLLPCSLLALLGCKGIDRVPVLEGNQCASPRLATIACVIDGDTVDLEFCGGERVRLLGISAPEIAHSAGESDECYGREATERLTVLALGRTVELRFDHECYDVTESRRTLAYLYLQPEEGADDDVVHVNEQLLAEGYASVYEEFDDFVLADWFYAVEAEAREAQRGLWGACPEGA